MTLTARDLQQKAYHQGYAAGILGRKVSKDDWEPVFQTKYLQGYNAGKAVLEEAVASGGPAR